MVGIKTAGYGSWKSPRKSDLVSSRAMRLDGQIEIESDEVYLVEMRPAEAGRYIVVHWSSSGQVADIIPELYNARTRLYEYGGAFFNRQGRSLLFQFRRPVPLPPESRFWSRTNYS